MNKIQTTILIDKIVRGLRLTRGGFTNRAFSKNADSFLLEDNHFIFDSFHGRRIGCNPLFIFRELVERFPRGSCRFTWVTRPDTIIPDDIKKNPDVRFVTYERMEHLVALAKSKYIIFNSTLPFIFAPKKEQVLLSTWHGIPIKKMGVQHEPMLAASYNTQRCLNISDIILSSGNFFDRAFLDATLAPLEKSHIRHIGFPRNDIAYRSENTKPQSQSGKPKLLYAPTWRGRLNEIDQELNEQIEVSEMLAKEFSERYDVYVSLHYFAERKINWQKTGVKAIPKGIDINEFLTQTDLLLSDYSSVILDYLLLDRPVVLYAYDLLDYRGERGFSLDYTKLPCQIAETREQVLEMIRNPRKPSSFSDYTNTIDVLFGDKNERASFDSANLLLNYAPSIQKTEKKKVLIYPSTFRRNGITTSFLNLINALDGDLVDISVFCEVKYLDRDESRREQFNLLSDKVKKILFRNELQPKDRTRILRKIGITPSEESRMRQFNTIKNAFKTEYHRHLRDRAFDVAIDFSGYDVAGTMLSLAANTEKRVIYQHNDIASEIKTKGNINWLITTAYRDFDEIISVLPTLRDINRDAFAGPSDGEKFGYCRNVIGQEFMPGAEFAPCPWVAKMHELRSVNPNAKIFINAARISVEKNHRRLLRAFSILKNQNPNAFLFVLGDGPELEKVKRYAENIGLEDSCFFAGFVHKPAAAIKEADAFVLSSDYEGQPLVLLESLALGTPCVATNHPSMAYVIGDGLGVLTEKDDKALADGMAQVISEGYKPKRFDAKAYNDAALNEFYNLIGVETP